MAYTLVITEKPAASQKIAEALADKKAVKKIENGVPYYELTCKGKKMVVACAVGHLYALAEKKKSGFSYPTFDVEWKPTAEVNKKAGFAKKYLDIIAKLNSGADSYILATDYDTEGETIGYNILRFLCNVDDAERMKFSTLTKSDLISSYKNISKHIDKQLANAGVTRHILDFYWGINSSRALTSSTKKAGGFRILSSGRVQSPTLALLAKRECEIKSFKPDTFWQVFASVSVNSLLVRALHEKGKLFAKEEVERISQKCVGKNAKVIDILKRVYEVPPQPPFNITSLQAEAYRVFRFSPKQTMDIAQSLYLGAYISYPRTSSEKLPQSINYAEILKALSKEFKDAKEILKRKGIKPVEGKKEDPAHVAIYPTSSPPKQGVLNQLQKQLYTLVVKRFLALFCDSAERESVAVQFDINNETFTANGARTLKNGWLSVYSYSKLKEEELPGMEKNVVYNVKSVDIEEDQTKPPKRYTQGSIILEMEKRGLGTRATRSNILQTLYDRQYITDKTIHATELGEVLANTLEKHVPELVSEELTKHFEDEMEQIRVGKNSKETIEEAKKILVKILKHFKSNEEMIGRNLITASRETNYKSSVIGVCGVCSNDLRIIYSRKNKRYFIACSNYPKCTNTFSLPPGLPKPTGGTCKDCNFPVVLLIRAGKRPWRFCINRECPQKIEWAKNKDNAQVQ